MTFSLFICLLFFVIFCYFVIVWMETLLGIVGDGFAVIAADTLVSRSIVVMKGDQDKIVPIDKHKMMGLVGEPGDTALFGDLIQKNVSLYSFRNGVTMSTHAAANYTRNTLATAIREGPYACNVLMAGFDAQEGGSLYWIDYLGSMKKLDFGAQGYAAHFTLSLLDRHFRRGLNLQQAVEIIQQCIDELRLRFIINSSRFIIKVVDANGIRQIQ